MKAPFGRGDVVEKFKNCEHTHHKFPVGMVVPVVEIGYESWHGPGGPVIFKHLFNSRNGWACSCAYRLYEPPKPEESTKSVSRPVDAKAKEVV